MRGNYKTHIIAAATVHTFHGSRPGSAWENSWAASWARQSCPYKVHISWAAARPGSSNFESMGRGPARPINFSHDAPRPSRPINFSDDGPRPGPANRVSTRWATSRPGQSNFQNSRPSRARPINFSSLWAGQARPVTIFRSARPGPAPTFGPRHALVFSMSLKMLWSWRCRVQA